MIDIPDYDPLRGIHLQWEAGHRIFVEIGPDGSVMLTANREGLLSLAQHLLNLANPEIPKGNHIHLDSYGGLEEGSIELMLLKD